MEDKKILKLNLKQKNIEEQISDRNEKKQSYQTNPLLKTMFVSNIQNKKGKFDFKNLFK